VLEQEMKTAGAGAMYAGCGEAIAVGRPPLRGLRVLPIEIQYIDAGSGPGPDPYKLSGVLRP
jgi:hypothetical protein